MLNLSAEDFQVTESGVKREVLRASLGNAPMRIVLMVDSSTPVAPMINNFRTALSGFVDELPEVEEVVFISSGGQIRVRAQANAGRDKLRAEIGALFLRRRRQRLPRYGPRGRQAVPENRAGPMARFRRHHHRQR